MSRYKNYYNKRGKHNRIYSLEDLYKMSLGDFIDREDELDYQDSTIGLPYDEELKTSKNVRFIDGFTQDDGNVIPSRWESFAPVQEYTNPFDNTPSIIGGIAGNSNVRYNQAKNPTEMELPNFSDSPYADDNKTQNVQLPKQKPLFPELKPTHQQLHQEQQEHPEISTNLRDYINDMVGENIDYGFIGNKATTSSQPEIPIYPENRVIKGGISRTYLPAKDKDILAKSGGYVSPIKASRDYNLIDTGLMWVNDKLNKVNLDAKQMLEIGLYGVDSYEDNDQFKHIKDGSADLYNEKYKLTGNKTIPSDMKGIEFSKDSEFSRRISKNEDFQKTVKDTINKNNGQMPDKIELDFNKDSNLNYSLGHATLLNPKVTEDGYIEGVVYDKYDYDKKDEYDDYKNNPFLNSANNSAEYLHRKCKLEYYYYFVPVRFKY